MADSAERSEMQALVASELNFAARGTKFWSLLHHGFTFSAAILSALAALTLQLNSLPWSQTTRADIAAGLAAAASLIGVISISGAFGKKWRANRLTRSTLDRLSIDLTDPDCDIAAVRTALKEMKRVHDLAIVDDSGAPQVERKA